MNDDGLTLAQRLFGTNIEQQQLHEPEEWENTGQNRMIIGSEAPRHATHWS